MRTAIWPVVLSESLYRLARVCEPQAHVYPKSATLAYDTVQQLRRLISDGTGVVVREKLLELIHQK